MDTDQEILDYLAQQGAVLTGSHFIYTSGLHGTAYVNMRAVAHQAPWLEDRCCDLSQQFTGQDIELIVGPETLGRTLAQFLASAMGIPGIWCDIVQEGDRRYASFSPKLGFARLVAGKRVAIVDDLLTTGSSIKLTSDLIIASGGIPVFGAAVVRRTPDVSAEDCGVSKLVVMADVPGFNTFSAEECEAHGPCSQRIPVALRPGHGHEWIKDHPGYPTA